MIGSGPERMQVRLNTRHGPFDLDLTVPAGWIPLDELVPVLRDLASALAEHYARASPGPIACGPRCGACCRQLVPKCEPELRAMAREVAQLDSPHRERVRARFDTVIGGLERTGLPGPLRMPPTESAAYQSLLRRYFLSAWGAGLACPFLEDESCSIYSQRPMICREYAVTSPPARCNDPFAGGVEMVRLPTNVVSLLVQTVAK